MVVVSYLSGACYRITLHLGYNDTGGALAKWRQTNEIVTASINFAIATIKYKSNKTIKNIKYI